MIDPNGLSPEKIRELTQIHNAAGQYLKMMSNSAGGKWREIIVEMFARVAADSMKNNSEKEIQKFMMDMKKSVLKLIKLVEEQSAPTKEPHVEQPAVDKK